MKFALIARTQLTPDIASFSFRPLEPMSWTAGQSIRLELAAPDYGTYERRFSISSAPQEKQLTITTRASSSGFKQALFALEPGSTIDGYGIEGSFIWPVSGMPVFIAAGIGITPFRAMVAQKHLAGEGINASLHYSSHDTNFAFASELKQWQATDPSLSICWLPSARITVPYLQMHEPELANQPIYISGPSIFVDNLHTELIATDKIAPGRIHSDRFTGKLPPTG